MASIDVNHSEALGIVDCKAEIKKDGLHLRLRLDPPEGRPDTLGGVELDKLIILLNSARILFAEAKKAAQTATPTPEPVDTPPTTAAADSYPAPEDPAVKPLPLEDREGK